MAKTIWQPNPTRLHPTFGEATSTNSWFGKTVSWASRYLLASTKGIDSRLVFDFGDDPIFDRRSDFQWAVLCLIKDPTSSCNSIRKWRFDVTRLSDSIFDFRSIFDFPRNMEYRAWNGQSIIDFSDQLDLAWTKCSRMRPPEDTWVELRVFLTG